ncbi:hypothetical protein GCM10018952_22030 [Streptosporangium vulgare]
MRGDAPWGAIGHGTGDEVPKAAASEPSTATNLIRVMPAKGAEHVWRTISIFSSPAGA